MDKLLHRFEAMRNHCLFLQGRHHSSASSAVQSGFRPCTVSAIVAIIPEAELKDPKVKDLYHRFRSFYRSQ